MNSYYILLDSRDIPSFNLIDDKFNFESLCIIAGSRGIENYNVVKKAIYNSGFDIDVVVSGGARGVDMLGEKWAKENNIPVVRFEVTSEIWSDKGRKAGPKRNEEMAKYADSLVAVWDGESAGTESMIKIAKREGLRLFVKDTSKGSEQVNLHHY